MIIPWNLHIEYKFILVFCMRQEMNFWVLFIRISGLKGLEYQTACRHAYQLTSWNRHLVLGSINKECGWMLKDGEELAACHPYRDTAGERGELNDMIKRSTHYFPLWCGTFSLMAFQCVSSLTLAVSLSHSKVSIRFNSIRYRKYIGSSHSGCQPCFE
jgi:hypothetical protein